MSVTDDVLKANETYARNFTQGNLPMPPGRKLAVVACMDARLVVSQILGLKAGDAHVIRNAGGIVTGDVLRSLYERATMDGVFLLRDGLRYEISFYPLNPAWSTIRTAGAATSPPAPALTNIAHAAIFGCLTGV